MDGWFWKRKRSWVLATAAFFTQGRWLGGEHLLDSIGLRLQQEGASKSGALTWLDLGRVCPPPPAPCPKSGAKELIGL